MAKIMHIRSGLLLEVSRMTDGSHSYAFREVGGTRWDSVRSANDFLIAHFPAHHSNYMRVTN